MLAAILGGTISGLNIASAALAWEVDRGIDQAPRTLCTSVPRFSYTLFLTNDADINYLTGSSGWAIGSGPSVVVVDKRSAANMTTTTLTQDVYAAPFGQHGLYDGARFGRVQNHAHSLRSLRAGPCRSG